MIPCPEILLESVATHTYCIFLSVYSIGGIKITKVFPPFLIVFFKWSTTLSEMHHDNPIRNASRKGGVGGRWGAGAERHFELAR